MKGYLQRIGSMTGSKKIPVVSSPSSFATIARNWMNTISASSDIKIQEETESHVIVNVGGIELLLNAEEDFFVLNEVLVEKCYGLDLKQTYSVVDIGLNIGISALYFASNPFIEKIIGFEPMPQTFAQLQTNLLLNASKHGAKIESHCCGLGKENTVGTFIYSKEFKASVGVVPLNSYKMQHSESLQETKVEIRNAYDEILSIFTQNTGKKWILKMDCEGAEYDILASIAKNNLVDNFDIIIMEWHNEKEPLVLEHLKRFQCFYHKVSSNTGIVYAYKYN